MTKVQELQASIMHHSTMMNPREEVEDLISAVHAEGKAEGAEQGLNMAQRWMDSELMQNRHAISLPHDALLASVLALPIQTEKEHEVQFLRADIAAIDRLLAGLPTDHVIERLGFESRKKEEEDRLAVLAPTKETP